MRLGLDRLPEMTSLVSRLRGSRVAVLAHPASVDRTLSHIGDVLETCGVRPALFFGPEHGYGGEAQDMIGVADATDARTGAPIISLYGERFEDLSPKAADLARADVLLIDLADVGARYYTFVWTALLAVRAAARAGVHSVILDRPNPIGGLARDLEGRAQEAGFLSFVGLEPIPVRHSLTVGEIVAFFAERDGLALGPGGALSLVHLEGWERATRANAWNRPFVMPSPNMPAISTAHVYPGGCLLEGTNLSDGRGLTRPFEITGAPWIDGRKLAADLARSELPGFIARPLTFHPMFHKHAKTICGGVQIHISDPAAFRPYATYIALIGHARNQDPERFRFRTERYEYVDTIPAIDLLTGSSLVREALIGGHEPAAVAREAAAVPDSAVADHEAAILACRGASW